MRRLSCIYFCSFTQILAGFRVWTVIGYVNPFPFSYACIPVKHIKCMKGKWNCWFYFIFNSILSFCCSGFSPICTTTSLWAMSMLSFWIFFCIKAYFPCPCAYICAKCTNCGSFIQIINIYVYISLSSNVLPFCRSTFVQMPAFLRCKIAWLKTLFVNRTASNSAGNSVWEFVNEKWCPVVSQFSHSESYLFTFILFGHINQCVINFRFQF